MMNDIYFKELFRKNPREAVEAYYESHIKSINKKNYLELRVYKSISGIDTDNFVKDCIFEAFFEDKGNISLSVRSSIQERVEKLIKYMYEQTDKKIPLASFVAYCKFISTFNEDKMMQYEDDAYTFEGHSIQDHSERVYYTLINIFDDYREKMSQGEIPVELYSFIVDKMDEIDACIKAYDVEEATKIIVALQLYLDIGTDFIRVLPLYLTGEITLTDKLGLDKELGLIEGKGRIR